MSELYRVFNATDGIYASPDGMSDADADQFIHDFRRRFEEQGYYLDAQGQRLDPNQVILEKRPVDAEDELRS